MQCILLRFQQKRSIITKIKRCHHIKLRSIVAYITSQKGRSITASCSVRSWTKTVISLSVSQTDVSNVSSHGREQACREEPCSHSIVKDSFTPSVYLKRPNRLLRARGTLFGQLPASCCCCLPGKKSLQRAHKHLAVGRSLQANQHQHHAAVRNNSQTSLAGIEEPPWLTALA